MRRHKKTATTIVIVLAISSIFQVLRAEDAGPDVRAAAEKLLKDGNYQEALDKFRVLILRGNGGQQTGIDFRHAIQCYQPLNRVHEIDDFREEATTRHADNWQVLSTIAESYLNVQHYGYMIAGEFHRGQHRGGGKIVHASARDRVRALRLYWQAFQLVEKQPEVHVRNPARQLLEGFVAALAHNQSGQHAAWRMQMLTSLETEEKNELPDYEEGWGYYGQTRGAPVDEDGKPVFYDLPDSWQAAANDGERWRWVLEKSVEWQPELRNHVRLIRAQFLQSQFGVETMASYGWWFSRSHADRAVGDAQDDAQTGTFALHTLGENETIAKLATGIKRFELPDEHNHIRLYQLVADSKKPIHRSGHAHQALATIFENRRQYPRAAQYWREAIELAGSRTDFRQHLEQIVGNWGQFEPVMTQPAGQGATVDFRFRNGKRVEFTAKKIKLRQLLGDMKVYLTSNPQKLHWERVQLENLGHRLVTDGQEKYLGEESARWSLDLELRPNHFDRRITVTTPLQKAGAYLLTAKMADGNTNEVILWLSDTAIVKKPLESKAIYYVADALSGKPLAKCHVEFFGYWQEHLDRKKQGAQKFVVHTKNFAEFTDENGLVELPVDDANRRHQWVAVATTPEGRFAYLGFRGVWIGHYHVPHYEQVKALAITDRPVYRPGQPVKFKFWVRRAYYGDAESDPKGQSQFAGQTFQIEIRDPRNESVYTTSVIADAYGGLAGEWNLLKGATLGQYSLNVVNHGGGTFRVEEYKKPEFEVAIDAPGEPVALGEKIKAKITARYYFGSPVAQATVKYKIFRSEHTERWYPSGPWDWLYGPGYWWFAEDYSWYPGWGHWGCLRPTPWWFWHQPTPPELVVEREVPIGPDGTIEVEIDTALAKAIHPDQDHRYRIVAEVVDASRRTIVGTGQVLVARRPFRVYAWTDRGYYRVGDTIAASFSARTLDGKPVAGTGKLRLMKIRYEDAKPVETELSSWELTPDAEGLAQLQIKASETGQYRLAYEVTDGAGHAIEGGHVFTITGEGFDGSEFQFNELELVPDRRDYMPGDKVALQINTNRAGAVVLLFLRPASGIYQPPRVVRMTGKSTVVEIDVTASDSPNFFIEVITVHGGRLHTATREIHVPPAGRVLDVEVVPSAESYLPGAPAKVKLKLTDLDGKPFVGSTVVAIYDKALEYIAGGSNVPDIREFFWKWRRSHQPRNETNLGRGSGALVRRNRPTMQNLGIFGGTVADEVEGDFGDRKMKSRFGVANNNLRASPRRSMSLGLDAAMPMSAALEESSDLQSGEDASASGSLQPPPQVVPQIRKNFADTALWIASLETNAEGIAQVELDMPENLTTWMIRVWGMGHGTRVGQGTAEVVTRKNLIVRLQAPRFFVERDEVVLSANVHNYLDEAKEVRVQLALEGNTLECSKPEDPKPLEQVVRIEAGGEQRVDWRVNVVHEGTATIRMSALTDEESDAMEMEFPVYVHGMLKTESFSGSIRPKENLGGFKFTVPNERQAEQSRLEIRYSPTLAGAMVDALPYLLDYPYGCTEQTLNRFLPAVITQRSLQRMGLNLAAIREKRTNLNAQEISPQNGDDTDRAKGWRRFDRTPVFDEEEMTTIVKAGVNRLTEMQLSDGGWGWFSGWGERSTPHTTAVVVHGLQIAEQNSVALVPGVLDRGRTWLVRYQAEQLRLLKNWEEEKDAPNRKKPYKPYADNTDALVAMVLAERAGASPPPESSAQRTKMLNYLYRDRTKLAVYGLANFGLALHYQEPKARDASASRRNREVDKKSEMLQMIMQNIAQYLRQDEENQTAWLDLPGGHWWHWYGSEYEAHAYYLKLLALTDPKSEVAPQLVKYLLNNRKHATYWNSTRDTALVVEAFADYLKASGEDKPDLKLEVWIDGQMRKSVEVTGDNLFTFDNRLILTGDELSAGEHTVELRKQGRGPIYWNGYQTNFTLEDQIRAAGLELKVKRKFYKLTPIEASIDVAGGRGQATGQRVEKYQRTLLENLDELTSGDLVEVELTVDSKNDYEYIMLEDMKAAGLEPVEIRSGYNGNGDNFGGGAYMELRDNRVTLFVARLARGRHSARYRLRAEIPGKFSALPTRASAMYAPELKANSDEIRLGIVD